MIVYYSIGQKGFFVEGINEIPKDALSISEEHYEQLKNELAMGKVISYENGSLICSVDPARIGMEQAAEERSWRDIELSRVDNELNKVQDSDPKAQGTVADWREYRRKLRNYPEAEGFPSYTSRPESPY